MAANTITASGSTSLYSHTTVIVAKGVPDICIRSLKIPQLYLRLPCPEDAPALLGLFTDRLNVQYDKSCSGLDTPEAIASLITQWRDIAPPLERTNVVVVLDGVVIGTGGLGWIGQRSSDGKWIGDAGMMITPAQRGKGYAYEALRMILDHGYRVLIMDEIHVSCVDKNDAFKSLMNVKFGFLAAPCQDKFGNNWIWRITRETWMQSRHAAQVQDREQ
jgi:RimJ/RimL family protein N-acetyltransferase